MEVGIKSLLLLSL